MSRLIASDQREDQEALKAIALTDPNPNRRREAVALLKNQTVLKQIIRDDPVSMVKVEAIRQITDLHFLADVVIMADNSDIKRAALFRFERNPLLFKLWERRPADWWVRRIIAEQLSHSAQDELVTIASTDENVYVRQAAVEKLTSDHALFQVVNNCYAKYPETARFCIGRMTDVSLLLTLRLLVDERERRLVRNRLQQLRAKMGKHNLTHTRELKTR